MAIKISWATFDDMEDWVALDKLAHKENRNWLIGSRSGYRKMIRKSKFLMLMARCDGKLVGYLQSGLRNTKEHLWIEDITVVKEFRKRGIAKLMVNKFVRHWKSRAGAIVLITSDNNMKIFERLGFKKEMNYMGYKR